jgi:Flp pilus assembly pilin Flp
MAERIIKAIWTVRIWKDTSGQDMLEYALYCAAITMFYVAISPSVATSLSSIFSKINTSMSSAANTGA